MIKNTAMAEQFHNRSGNHSTKGSRKGFSLLGGGEDPVQHLTPEQRRASLVAVYKRTVEDAAKAKASNAPKAVIKQYGLALANLCKAIHDIRPKRTTAGDVASYFVLVCREQMTKPQYHALMDEANRRLKLDAEKAAKGISGKTGEA